MKWNARISDFHAAWRSLRSGLRLNLLLAGIFALGIGANVGVLSLFNAVVLRAPLFPDADQVVAIYQRFPGINLERGMTSVPDFADRRDRIDALSTMGLYRLQSLNLSRSNERAERIEAYRATASVFEALGVSPLLGSWFRRNAESPGQHRLLILSHSLWTSRFASDRNIVGREVGVDGEPYMVVAVMPEGFDFPSSRAQAWVPYAFTPEELGESSRVMGTSQVVARLAPGATFQQLEEQLAALSARSIESAGRANAEYGKYLRDSGFSIRAERWMELQVSAIRPILLLLQTAAGLVMLLACANISNVLLGNLVKRQQALSIRAALGAGRAHLIRAFTLEVILVALSGGAIGLALMEVFTRVAAGVSGFEILGKRAGSSLDDVALTLALSVAAALAASVIPAIALYRMNLQTSIREGGRAMGGGRRSSASRSILVTIQFALAAALLVSAGWLILSLWRAAGQSPGFAADAVLSANVDLVQQRYPDRASRLQYIDRATETLGAEPGVADVAFVSALPFSGANASGSFEIEGVPSSNGNDRPHALHRHIHGNYFGVMGVPVLRGRAFDRSDRADGDPVVIIDQYLVRTHFGDRDPLGARIRFGLPPDVVSARIVGVVGTIHHSDLTTPIAKGTLYWPLSQMDRARGSLVLRVRNGQGEMPARVQALMSGIDPQQPVYEVQWLADRVDQSLDRQRGPMYLIVAFGAIAVLLAGVGVYGVVGMAVEQRRSEIATRLALGETARGVTWLIGGQVVRWLSAGLLVGLVMALALSRLMTGLLFGVSPQSPWIHLGVTGLMMFATALAVAIPLRRATQIAPSVAMRS